MTIPQPGDWPFATLSIRVRWFGDPGPAAEIIGRQAPNVQLAVSGTGVIDDADLVGAGPPEARVPFDLVVLDSTAPAVEAARVLQTLRTHRVDVPVVLLVDSWNAEVGAEATALDLCDYLVKTDGYAHQLLPALARAIAGHQLLRAHRTSRQREARLRSMVEGLPVPFSVMAANGRISAMNAAGVELLGARLEEVVGQNLVGFVPSDEQEAVAAFVQHVCDRESGVLTHTLIGVDGRRRPVRTHAVQLLGPGSSAAMAVIRDDTDYYQLQQAAREARVRFTRLAERTDAAVLMWQDARLWFANRPLADLTGYTVEELQDIDLATLVPPDYLTVFEVAEPAMEAGRGTATPTELALITKHGERVRLEATVTGVLHQGRAAALVIARQPGDRASRAGTSARDDEGASEGPGARGQVLPHALAAAEARCEQLSAEHAKERERLEATRRLAEIYSQTLTQEHAAERRQFEDRLEEAQARHAERLQEVQAERDAAIEAREQADERHAQDYREHAAERASLQAAFADAEAGYRRSLHAYETQRERFLDALRQAEARYRTHEEDLGRHHSLLANSLQELERLASLDAELWAMERLGLEGLRQGVECEAEQPATPSTERQPQRGDVESED